MKKIILAFTILFTSYNAISSPLKDSLVVVLNTSNDIFYFKIDKTMIGGIVEVFSANGELVASQNLESKKLIIDFFEMNPGDYKIVVKKENVEETFTYIREAYNMRVMNVVANNSK